MEVGIVLPLNGQTYDIWRSDVDSLSPEVRRRPCLCNLEFPWLEVLAWPNDAPDVDTMAAWKSRSSVAPEVARYNSNNGTSWTVESLTMEQFREVARALWIDATAYWYAQGGGSLFHYGSAAYPNNSLLGTYAVPGIATRSPSTLPLVPNTIQYVLESTGWNPSNKTSSTAWPNPKVKSLLLAQSNAAAYGQSAYCFLPTNGRAISNFSDWTADDTSGNLNTFFRQNGSPIAGPPPYLNLESYLYWMSRWGKGQIRHTFNANQNAYANDPSLIAHAPDGNCLIWYAGSPVDVAAGRYVVKNHWGGLFDSSPEERVRILFEECFKANDPNDESDFSGNLARPDAVWNWDAAYYYQYDLLSQNYSGAAASSTARTLQLATYCARYGWERMFLGVPMSPAGSPIGSVATAPSGRLYYQGPNGVAPDGSNGGIHFNHFFNWTLPIVPWLQSAGGARWPASQVWHDYTLGGSQLPNCPDGSPRSLIGPVENGHALMPYLRDSQYSPINGQVVALAYLQFVADQAARQFEEWRRIADQYNPEPFP
jgi:hypothetical protein